MRSVTAKTRPEIVVPAATQAPPITEAIARLDVLADAFARVGNLGVATELAEISNLLQGSAPSDKHRGPAA